MRRTWRLVRLFATMLGRTVWMSLDARRRPPEMRAAYRARKQQAGTQRLCRILGLRVDLAGEVPEGGMLAVCNHLGVLDPLVLASVMPVSFAGKAELRRWPFIGWVCRTFGLIFVERERPTQTSAFVQQVHAKLRQGVRVLVFPEGTTSRGDTVRTFKTGAFEAVAGLENAAVLPLFLEVVSVNGLPADDAHREEVAWADGTETFVEHAWHLLGLRNVHYRVHVGEPIATAERDRKTLAREAHTRVCSLSPHRLTASAA